MDKQELEKGIAAFDRLAEIIVKLSGNLMAAERALRGSDLERDYTRNALYWDACEPLEALKDIQLLKASFSNELDCVSR